MQMAPDLIEARKNHFARLHQVIQQWKEQLVLEVPDSQGKFDINFPHIYKYDDLLKHTILGTQGKKGCLHWYKAIDSSVKVWFSVEDNSIFRCLQAHLQNKQLWRDFNKLKQEIANGITQAFLHKDLKVTIYRIASPLAYQIATELDIALSQIILPGKCEACPEEV